MPLFDTPTIKRWFEQGENEISVDRPFLTDRLSIAMVANTNVYTLPDYVISIRRITWRGMKLDPLPHRNFREVFQSATQKGRPFWYVYNNIGQNQIQLFPGPQENIAQVTSSLYVGANIKSGFVVEFYRATDNNLFVIPAYARRQLLKSYTGKMVYSIEVSGQNIKLAKYFGVRWENWKKDFTNHLDDLYGRPRKLIINEIVSNNYFPAAPILPIARFGISVDEGM